jgi:hypothetical protein
MGTAGSSANYKSHAQVEAERIAKLECARGKKQQREREREQKRAEDAAREAWLRNYRAAGGGSGRQKKWWNSDWWPLYSWWKERRAWKAELARRKGMGYTRLDDVPLKPHGE